MTSVLCLSLAACGETTRQSGSQPNTRVTAPPEDMGAEVEYDTRATPHAERQLTYQEVQLLLRNEVSAFNRLFETSLPLFASGARFCEGNIRPGLGFLHWNNEIYGEEFSAEVERIFGVDNQLSVRAVAPKSPAAKQGLEVGDVIRKVGPVPIPAGAAGAEAFLKGFDADIEDGTVVLEVSRKGTTITGRIKAVPVCNYGVDILPHGNELETQTVKDIILVSLPLIGYAESDAELATILAYELARDIQARRGMISSRGATSSPSPAQIEADLDRLALYIVARAGHDLRGIDTFLSRLSADPAAMAPWARSMSPLRQSRITNLMQEIRARKAADLPLVPRRGTTLPARES